MQKFLGVILESGRSTVDLALYVLLPIMIVMLAMMRLLEAKGVLRFLARVLSPALKIFGIPGLGAFAALQLLFVSFAAPGATLRIMERDGTQPREIAATLAMVLAMSQANTTLPLVALGLSFGVTLLTSLLGGLTAAALTYHWLAKSLADDAAAVAPVLDRAQPPKRGVLGALIDGGQEGLELVWKSVPVLLLAIFVVNAAQAAGVIGWLEPLVSPVLGYVRLPGVALLPIATKYVAGGTAMTGVTLEMLREGSLTALDLNRLAGFIINPLDLVGLAVLASAGPRTAAVARVAALGAAGGVLLRGVLHLVLF